MSLFENYPVILDKHAHPFKDHENRDITLGHVLRAFGSIQRCLYKVHKHINVSDRERAKSRLKTMAGEAWSNPVAIYLAAGARQTKVDEDRIYGIMQVFGFQLGHSRTPNHQYRLPDLELQFAEKINAKSSIFGQMFVHVRRPVAGRSWCISQDCEFPEALKHSANDIFYHSQSHRTVQVDSSGRARFSGFATPFPQLAAALDCATRKPDEQGFWGSGKPANGFREIEMYDLDACGFTEKHVREDLRHIAPKHHDAKQELRNISVDRLGKNLYVLVVGKISSDKFVKVGEENIKVEASFALLARSVRREERYILQRIGIVIWESFGKVEVPAVNCRFLNDVTLD